MTTDPPWISFTLKNNKSFYITHYELQQRKDASISDFHRNWVFEGKRKTYWTILDRQIINDNDPYRTNAASKVFTSKHGNFDSFRVRSMIKGILVIQKIEIYGYLCENSTLCQLDFLFQHHTCHNILSKLIVPLSLTIFSSS